MDETPEQKAAREAQEAADKALGDKIAAEVKKATGGLAKLVSDAVKNAVSEIKPAEPIEPIKPGDNAELIAERKKREALDKRVTELVEEGKKAREAAERNERHANIKAALQEAGVTKVDLAFRAVNPDIKRNEAGDLVADVSGSEVTLKDHLAAWTKANPEFLPARTVGGSGNQPGRGGAKDQGGQIGMEDIRPGKITDQMREEIARVASSTMLGNVVQ